MILTELKEIKHVTGYVNDHNLPNIG